MSISVETLALAKKFTNQSIAGISGSLAGKNCTIKSITHDDTAKESTVTFEWTADDGTTRTNTMVVPDGVQGIQGKSVASAKFDADGKLVFVLDDGTELAGLVVPTSSVEISKATGNIITQKADGMYAPSTDISGKVDKVDGKSLVSDTDIAQITTNKNAITTLNGNSTVAGSVDKKIADAIGGITGFDYEVVTTLPSTGTKGKIYLVANGGTTPNVYDEYIWIGDKFEKIGTTEIDLTQYFKKENIVTSFSTTTSDSKVASEKLVKDSLDDKADKSSVNAIYDGGFVSRNLFDEQMEIGGIDTTSGANVTYATRMRSANYAEIDATKSYYICTQSTVSTSATKLRVFYYDNSKAFVSYQDWTNELIIPSGAKYIRFITIDGYGTTYNDDIILNVSDSKNGTYQPYAKSNIELTKIVNDDLKMLGWTVPSECPIQNYTDANGVFHQRVGRVDLGSLTWSYLTSPAPYFGTDLSNIKINTNNMYCKSYPITQSNVGIANMPDKTLKSDGGSYAKVYVKDSAYTDATTFKSAMSGVYLYYELATEITKSVDGNEYVPEELAKKLDSDDYKLTDLINDTTKSTSTVYSSNKVESKLAGYLPMTKLTGKTSYTIDPTNYHMIFFDCVKDNARLKSIIGVGQTGQCELVSGSTFAKITNSSSTSVTITGQTTLTSLTLICI